MGENIIYILVSLLLLSCGHPGDNKTKMENSIDNEIVNKTGLNVQTSISTDDCDNALKFINGYVDNLNEMNKAIGIIEWVNSNQLVTESFKKELSRILDESYKNDPELGLGFDPIFDAQDYPDSGFEIGSIDTISNYLILKGKDWSQFKIVMKVKYEDTNWLVDGCGIINIPKEKRIEK